jgi:3(or 17)beta-hydroxysteroid dehydrogenase
MSVPRRLASSVVLVTGGAAGLGKAIAQRLLAEGATVVISDLQRDLGRSTAAECGFTFLEQDVCDEARWTQVVDEIERRFGRLSTLINNAAILGPTQAASPESTTLASWKQIFAVNVQGVFLGCRAALAAMRRGGGGSIVNLSSIADQRSTPHATAYGASKAAVTHLTKSVAHYCAQQKVNVRCNSVHPGMIRTPLLNQAIEEAAQQRAVPADQIIMEYRSAIPLGDFTRGEDVAAAIAFLCSEDARHITGSSLLVDGGIVHCSSLGT